jgi:hypothetical protein
MKLDFSRYFLKKYTKIKFHENPSIGSRVIPYGCTDRRTDMAELIVAFSSFANAPKSHDGLCIYKFASYVAKYKCCYLECAQSGQECVPCLSCGKSQSEADFFSVFR